MQIGLIALSVLMPPSRWRPGPAGLMFHYGSVSFDMHTLRQGFPTTDNGLCLTPNVTHARSRGTVRLRSRDYPDKPKVDPRYFTDPHDMRVMFAGICAELVKAARAQAS